MGLLIIWKIWLFLDFQYGFMSSRSTADFMTVVGDATIRAFNMSGTTAGTRALTLDISKAFIKV